MAGLNFGHYVGQSRWTSASAVQLGIPHFVLEIVDEVAVVVNLGLMDRLGSWAGCGDAVNGSHFQISVMAVVGC